MTVRAVVCLGLVLCFATAAYAQEREDYAVVGEDGTVENIIVVDPANMPELPGKRLVKRGQNAATDGRWSEARGFEFSPEQMAKMQAKRDRVKAQMDARAAALAERQAQEQLILDMNARLEALEQRGGPR